VPIILLSLLQLSHICFAFKFYSPPAFALARKILLGVIPNFDLHHYQINRIWKVMDGVDLVAVTPTGSGKTAYLLGELLLVGAVFSSDIPVFWGRFFRAE
jgi:hypothetical protein